MSTSIRSILVNVAGTNPQTRASKSILKRFDGQGREVDSTGAVLSAPSLEGIGGSSTPAPIFPQDKFNEAAAKNDYATVQAITMAHADRVQAWQKSNEGGSEEARIAKAVLAYLYKFHGFLAEDGDGFVIKMDNLDVKRDELKDGGLFYTVSGTAVFGLSTESLEWDAQMRAQFGR